MVDYSHVGIVVIEDGRPYVIHVDPSNNPITDRVVKEPLQILITPKRIRGASVFRLVDAPQLNKAILEASLTAKRFLREQLPFDHEFDLATPQKLYCTELIWRAYLTAGIDLCPGSFGQGRKYLLPADLIRSGLLQEVITH